MKRLAISVLIGLCLLVFNAMPLYADQADPDSDPTVESINIYRHLRQSDDMLVIIYANIPYAAPPTATVTQAFIWRLFDTDNVTQFGSTTGYVYENNGYGYNVFSLYFSAAEVTALGIVWNTPYTVRLSGNPAVFDDPPIYTYLIDVSDYSTATTQADAQAELATRIIELASSLDINWGLTPNLDSLLTENEAATVLSIYGEGFFRGAIYGLQAMAPAAFNTVVQAIDIDAREWDPEYSENLTGQYDGTWIQTAQEAGNVLFNTDYDLLSLMIVLACSVALMLGNIMLTGDHWNGLIDVAVLAVICARLAMYDLAFLLLIAAMCWLYISAKIWFGVIR